MNTNKDLKYIRAKNKVQREKGFYTHLAIYIIINLIITGFKTIGSLSSWEEFSDELLSLNVLSSWVLWGIFLIIHYFAYRYGGEWEEKKIKELMDKELSKK